MASDAENLLQNISIESYIQRYLQLKRKGNNLWALCPFHSEKSPSFSISPEKGIFKCFGCGKGGNLITFVQLYEHVDFPEALKMLSEYSGIPLEGSRNKSKTESKNHRDLLVSLNHKAKDIFASEIQSAAVQEYLKERNIRTDSVQTFSLGFSPPQFKFLEKSLYKNLQAADQENLQKGLLELGLLGQGSDGSIYNRFQDRLIFPIIDIRGKCVGFGGRIIENKENTGKYINSPDSLVFHKKNSLYNLNRAKEFIRQDGQVIVVEGYLDVIGLYQAGIDNVVAPLGTAFTPEQARMLKRYTDRVILFFDSDTAGVEASFKALGLARNQKLDARVVVQNSQKDPFDLSQTLTKVDLLSLMDTARSETAFVLWYFFSHKNNISRITEKRTAIESLFQYVSELEQEWEKDEYLKAAAPVIEVDFEALKSDFGKYFKTGNMVAPRQEKFSAPEKVPNIEKEILSLLLKFPAYWQKEALLAEMRWTHKNIYLLFTFFRDRLKAGEFWNWNELSQALNLLPEDLSNLLTEIMMEMEDIFADWEKTRKTDSADMEKYFMKKLENLIFQHKKNKINLEITDLQKSLASAERLQDENMDSIAEELHNLLNDKTKIEKFLAENK
ncbi:MAG: DNA primase [Spirochaetia bacterium]|nr:DNA primase [Spirochaetia bacterium]